MRQLRKDLNSLSDQDIINLLLLGLYKLSDKPEYSTLCELVYCLDKNSLYKLCAVYGGSTISVPTISELEQIVDVLCVYQKIYEGKTFEEAYKELELTMNKKELFEKYKAFSEVLEPFE